MKRLFTLTALVLMLLNAGADIFGQQTRQGIALFNGKDLSNWTFYLQDPDVDPSTVFTVQDGVIHIRGDFGYMRTKDEYSDYRLTLEWRWPEEATNSGVFLHTQSEDNIWPQNFECQLAAGRAGDIYCAGGTKMAEMTQRPIISKFNESNEKPVGEWNSLEVTCRGNTIEIIVNGLLQNRGTEASVTEGNICLQSEGKDIEFRNVLLIPLAE
jgi:hypothetical protein